MNGYDTNKRNCWKENERKKGKEKDLQKIKGNFHR
jgi:hypothetical protein